MPSDSDLHEPRTDAVQSETGDDLRVSYESEPQRTGDGRLFYFEHQVQRSPRYKGYLNELPIEEVRALFEEMLEFSGICYWDEIPLPAAGLPGLLHEKYETREEAFDLLQIGIEYAVAIIKNERKTMHNRWRQARELIRDLEDRGRVLAAKEETDRAIAAMEARAAATAFVYFIGAASGPIKIGMAANPQERLKGLQTSHHEKLGILATCEGGAQQERAYHKRFGVHRLNGEWFERCPEIEAEIERLSTPPRS